MKNIYPALIASFFAFFVSINIVVAQSNGDYRTKAAGNWNGSSVWQKYNGSSWANTSTAPTNANGIITISHNISVTANATASQIVLAGGVLTVDDGITLAVSGSFAINSGTVKAESSPFSITSSTLTIGGNLTLNNSGIITSESAAFSACTMNIELKGNFVMNNSSIIHTDQGFLSGASVNFNFTGTGIQVFSKTGGTISNTINFSIAAGSTVDFTTSVLSGSDGTFTMNDGAKIIVGNSNPIQVNGTKTFSSNADYEFRGAVTPVFNTTPLANTARDIIINNTSGNVALSQAMTVTRDLKLQNGELTTTSANIITLNDNATASTYSNSSFITGPVIKKGNDDFLFPVGRSGAGLVPVKISGLSGPSDFRAEYKRAPAPSGNSITAPGLYRVSYCEYWTLDRTGSATANVTLHWNPQSSCNAAAYTTQLSSIVVAHFNGTSWNAYGNNGGTTGNISSGSVTWNSVSAFSPFALGSTDAAQNPLPVLLTNVIAYGKNNGVQVEWSNMNEENIDHYVVERSGNEADFVVIGTQQPKLNNSSRADYAYLDATANRGLNFYRVTAYEASGKAVISKVLRVETGQTNQSLRIYPNPVTGTQFIISLINDKPGQFKLQVFSAAGEEVFAKKMGGFAAVVTETIQLPPSMPSGIYTILVTDSDNDVQTKRFIIP